MKLFSNEIVFRGHPDKVCDQISDAIVDAYLEKDKNCRVACEVVGGKGIVFITGEITSNAKINIKKIARRVLKDVGYENNYKIIDNIGKQSIDIALGTNDKVGGAGDNGMMFGYACNETKQMLPKAMVILQEFSLLYDTLRKLDLRFKSDGKAQITGYYDENNKLLKIKNATICYQNIEKNRNSTDRLIKSIFENICKKYSVEVEEYLINPTGRFEIGGFEGDAGLTGRKIVVDSYHSFANVGGGAFSGKDPSKVDRSGAYMARKLAVEYLEKNEEISFCEIQISYAIGIVMPLAIYIRTNRGNEEVPSDYYVRCRLFNIIDELGLLNRKYEKLACFGHFSREDDFN